MNGATGDIPEIPPYYLPYFIRYEGLQIPNGYEIDTTGDHGAFETSDTVAACLGAVDSRRVHLAYMNTLTTYGKNSYAEAQNAIDVITGTWAMTPDEPGPITIRLKLYLKEVTAS